MGPLGDPLAASDRAASLLPVRLGRVAISVALVAVCCSPEEKAPALKERQRLALWAEHYSLEERLRVAGEDPGLVEDRDRFLAQTETRYGLTPSDFSRLTEKHGQRWLASAACSPPKGPIRQHALVVRRDRSSLFTPPTRPPRVLTASRALPSSSSW